MGEILGLGCTHYPGLMVPDEQLPGLFHRLLTAPNVPEHYKNSSILSLSLGTDGIVLRLGA